MGKQKSALEAAREVYKTKVEIPKLYVDAFLCAQKLEVYLHWIYSNYVRSIQSRLEGTGVLYEPKTEKNWNSKDYLKRIENFLPKSKNPIFFQKVKKAMQARNKFVHNCFKIENEKGVGLRMYADYHLDSESLKVLNEWLKVCNDSEGVILTVWKNSLKSEKS